MLLLPPRSTLFPYTTLFRSEANGLTPEQMVNLTNLDLAAGRPEAAASARDDREVIASGLSKVIAEEPMTDRDGDRKSTRLNSSHANISYAVFCLKKKHDNPF